MSWRGDLTELRETQLLTHGGDSDEAPPNIAISTAYKLDDHHSNHSREEEVVSRLDGPGEAHEQR